MKNWITTFTSFVLIALIAYGGSGVNKYFFCCNDCRNDGVIKAIAEHNCCERHHHNRIDNILRKPATLLLTTHVATTYACDEATHEACNVQRISVNWQTAQSENPEIAPISFDIFSSITHLSTPQTTGLNTNEFFIHYSNTQKPPNLDKDIYLSLLNTLII